MKHCNLCGRAVRAQEFRIFPRHSEPDLPGLVVCIDCEWTRPPCLLCHVPLSPTLQELGICRDCLRQGLNCIACGSPISGRFLLLNANQGPFCETCYKTRKRCEICGELANTGVAQEKSVLCPRCRETMIRDPRDAEALYRKAIDGLVHSQSIQTTRPGRSGSLWRGKMRNS